MFKYIFRWITIALVLSLWTTVPATAEEPSRAFRQKNHLIINEPPAWFLNGYFIAREKNPTYIFGPVADFVRVLGGTSTWLIEDLELKRVQAASAERKTPEYTLYLEVKTSQRLEYWIFVVLPYRNAQEWFDARRAFHGRKAEAYYRDTQMNLENAAGQGIKIKAELRFFIESGQTSVLVPENIIMGKYRYMPVFDLFAGFLMKPGR
jgi:hypothetical protein